MVRRRPCRLWLPLASLPLLLQGCGSEAARLRELSAAWKQREGREVAREEALGLRLDRLERPPAEGGPPARARAPRIRAAAASGAQRALYGGTLRLALGTDPPVLDPVKVEDTTSFQVGVQIMEGLLEFDRDLNLVPVIARRWSVSEDRRTYTFELHRGVRFHHGREVTAEDFVYSIGRNLDPKALGVRAYLFDRILGYPLFAALRAAGDLARKLAAGEAVESEAREAARERLAGVDLAAVGGLGHPHPGEVVALAAELVAALAGGAPEGAPEGALERGEALRARVQALSVWDFLGRGLRAPDPHTFVVELEQPFAPFAWNLPMVNAAVVPREEVERLGAEFAFRPVGSGPFRFVRWEHDVVVQLEAFEDYFQGRPYLDRIEYRIIPDALTQLIEYEVGNLDLTSTIPDERYQQIVADPPGELDEYPLLHVFYLGFNPSRPPFDDVRVRRAFNHAVDKRQILEKVKKGRGVVAKGPLPPAFKAYDPDLEGYGYDPARARALLAEAGYGPDRPLRDVPLWFNTATGSDANAKIAEVVQAELREVGVELELKGLAWGTYLDFVHRCEPPFYRLAWLPSHPNGDAILYALFRSGSASNASCYSNPEVDRLLDRARAEHDDVARVALYREAQRRIVADAPWIPLYHAKESYLRRPWVRDVRLNSRGADAVRYRRVWLDEGRRQAPESG